MEHFGTLRNTRNTGSGTSGGIGRLPVPAVDPPRGDEETSIRRARDAKTVGTARRHLLSRPPRLAMTELSRSDNMRRSTTSDSNSLGVLARIMRFGWRWIALMGAALVPLPEGESVAEEGSPRASSQRPRVAIRAGLPRHEIDARRNLAARQVSARERVRFTNRSGVEVRELVLHVYPRFQVRDKDAAILSKTLEVLRLSPEEAMDTRGRRIHIGHVRIAGR